MEEIFRTTVDMPLNEQNELPNEFMSRWSQSNIQEKKRSLFKWALPALDFRGMRESNSNSNPGEPRLFRRTYKIGDVKVTVLELTFSSLNQYSVQFTSQNEMSTDFFIHRYMAHSETTINAEEECFKFIDNLFPTFQSRYHLKIRFESELENALECNLCSLIRLMIIGSLKQDTIKNRLTQDITSFLEQKGLTTTPTEQWPHINPKPDFVGGGNFGTYAMGFSSKPDLMIGYTQSFGNPVNDQFVCLTSIGEVKLPSMSFEFEYELPLDQEAEARPITTETEFKKMVNKLVTIAVHTGVNRLVLTNYSKFILIEILPEFSILGIQRGVQKIHSLYKVVDGSEPYVRLFVFFFLFNTNEQINRMKTFQTNVLAALKAEVDGLLERQRILNMGLLPPNSSSSDGSNASILRQQQYAGRRPNRSRRPTTRSSGGDQQHGETHPDTSRRAATALVTDESIDEPSQRSTTSLSTGESTGSSDQLFEVAESSSNSTESSSKSAEDGHHDANPRYPKFSLIADLFASQFLVELGKATSRYLQVGEGLNSQVLEVHTEFFLGHINDLNKFCSSDQQVPKLSTLKIYDPNWMGPSKFSNDDDEPNEPGEIEHLQYQHCLDVLVNELKCYCALTLELGIIVPHIIAYGNLTDVEVSIGKGYFRFEGPFLLMESLEPIEQIDVNREFIRTSIIPQFRRIHEHKILHNDICPNNIIITKSKEVKIIDFGSAIFPCEDPEMFEREIRNVYRCFGESWP